MAKKSLVGICALTIVMASSCLSLRDASAAAVGPSAYLSFADSPFNGGSFTYFHLETFEDHLLNTPGVTANAGGVTSVVFGPSIHDSVDAADGAIDGSGLAGDSYFSSSGSAGVRFTFSAAVLGSLATHAGMVWTDGADEDRFFGWINGGGISSILVSNTGGGIEVDHLQYGLAGRTAPVPEPSSILLLASGLTGLAAWRWKKSS